MASKRHIVFSGRLYPSDGLEGCSFVVEANEQEYLFDVTIRSPYVNNDIVAEKKNIIAHDVMNFLLEHNDY